MNPLTELLSLFTSLPRLAILSMLSSEKDWTRAIPRAWMVDPPLSQFCVWFLPQVLANAASSVPDLPSPHDHPKNAGFYPEDLGSLVAPSSVNLQDSAPNDQAREQGSIGQRFLAVVKGMKSLNVELSWRFVATLLRLVWAKERNAVGRSRLGTTSQPTKRSSG